MAAAAQQVEQFEVDSGGVAIRGEREGEGPVLVCCHGLTATRRYVLHGSRLLARRGLRVVSYDARGHGESGPAPSSDRYGYPDLADDLERIIESLAGPAASSERGVVLAGHSMGAHTIVALALARPDLVRGLVVIGPVYPGGEIRESALASWDALARALREGGPEEFADAVAEGYEGEDRDLIHRLALERIRLHRDLGAVVDALATVPRSRPFGERQDLAAITAPTLVVASHDRLDPAHPYACAVAYAETIPGARLISEEEGASPLAWQGGRLTREIAAFAEQAGLLGG